MTAHTPGPWIASTAGVMTLPARTSETMGDAIALSSPSGRMSNRARKAAQERLRVALFGKEGLQRPSVPQPTKRERLLAQAANLRDLAARGMRPRTFLRDAARLEAEAAALDG